MKREPFIAARKQRWREYEKLVKVLGESKKKRKGASNLGDLPQLYRQICQDLALAKHRQYGRALIERLNDLALLGHEQLHKRPRRIVRDFIVFVHSGFPSLVRANARYFWAANALFYGPFALMMLASWFYPEALFAIMGPEEMRTYEEMYDPALNPIDGGRDSGTDITMFGFYIYNNIGIAFRTFAGGIFLGLGSVFFLVFNGLAMGAVIGHLARSGLGGNIFPFIIGHGAFELTAIVFAGAAGMKVGVSLLAPGRRTRAQALVHSGQTAIRILFGSAGMLLIAAFVEGFWSPSSAPSSVKYAVGGMAWLGVLLYFMFSGRSRAA